MNSTNKPDLPDIQAILEQLPDAPDWLWKGLVVAASWEATKWAWNHREHIVQKIRANLPQTLPVYGIPSAQAIGEPTLIASVDADLRWKVEAPTRPLAERLAEEGLELLSWYLRHA